MTQSELVRVNSSFSMRGGALFKSPLAEAADRWGPDGDTVKLREWLNDPTTRQMVGLIKELTFNPPPGFVSTDKIENYGVTSGLQLAVRVLEDPTILFSERFENQGPRETVLPEADYTKGAYEGMPL